MGLAASQARFLQLTARRSNIEYEAQQINFQRIQWSDRLAEASAKYEDATTNRHLVFSFNTGEGTMEVPVSYSNYKNYMNQQMEGVKSTHDKFYLMSSSGNKIIVSSEAERDAMIKSHAPEGSDTSLFAMDDFMIVEDLDDVDNFQKAIKDGVYFFGRFKEENGEQVLRTESWETLGAGAITDTIDKTDDAQAEAEYKAFSDKVQSIDKKLELRLQQLESDRSAIQTEIESVTKVMQDNVEKTFTTFG